MQGRGEQEFELLERVVRRTGYFTLAFASTWSAFVVAIPGFVFASSLVHGTLMANAAPLAFCCIVPGLLLASGWKQWRNVRRLLPATRARVYTELKEPTGAICWAYVDGNALHVGFRDGWELGLNAGADAARLLDFLRGRVPDVMLGNGPEQRAAYLALVKQERAKR